MSLNHFIPQRNEEALKVQYQPLFPLVYDGLFGPYKPVASLRDSIQKDFEYLLLTNPGEWPMNPDLGIGVKRYLFENYGSPEIGKIQERMRIQLERYLPFPYVQLISAKFEASEDEQDQGIVNLKIRYAILDDLVRILIVTREGINITDTVERARFADISRAAIPTNLRSSMRTFR
tara:strand:- start:29136 stop:29663 length:528 start_codon:yes stop_codon:yes gene_type:complete